MTPEGLRTLGETAFGGQSPHPPGYSALPVAELDGPVVQAISVVGYTNAPSPEWDSLRRRFLNELTAPAELGGPWAYVGALAIAANFYSGTDARDPAFLNILDRALELLRSDGVAYTALPPYALERWQEVHGFEGAGPARWPRALEDVDVPPPGSEPPYEELGDGEIRRLAQPHGAAGSNVISVERREGGQFVAVIDGVDAADGVRKRWDWAGLTAPDYPSFLRELGERLVTPSFWAHPDLDPYFPCRQRSRDQMRLAARAL